MFEKASKLKLRFGTMSGNCTTEDLWDLPLQSANKASLDSIAISLSKELKASGEESFVNKAPAVNVLLQLKLDIVKHIIAIKLAEKEQATKAAEKRLHNEKVLGLIAQKEDETLAGKSVEELKSLLM